MHLLPALLIFGLGGGLTLPAPAMLGMSAATPADAGLVSGLFNTTQQVGAALGVAAISSVTFPVDLALLTAARSGLHWPLPASITVAYLLASGLGYLLNRSLNFRSHAAVGPQLARYTVVLVINYFGCILGVTTGLAALGLNYQLARTAASGCEMAYMYAAMRWIVFGDPPVTGHRDSARPGPGGAAR